MVDTVRVPKQWEPIFKAADKFVGELFQEFVREPHKGMIHVGGERYILHRRRRRFPGPDRPDGCRTEISQAGGNRFIGLRALAREPARNHLDLTFPLICFVISFP